jgi:RNA polymerase-binding protein DksA
MDTDRFRTRLLEERTRLQDAVTYMHDEREGAQEDEGANELSTADNHLGDMATNLHDRELNEGLEEDGTEVLAQIDAALKRIDEGTYGTCERCGKPIGEERLEARPWATLCIDDARIAEGIA